MLDRPLRLLIALALFLFLAACGGSDDQADDATTSSTAESTTTTTEADVPEEALAAADEPGPFPVGRRTVQVVDPARDDRSLAVEIWYPAASAGEPSPYELIPGVAFDADLATVDAPESTEGPFPLVVFSHGSGGLRQQSATIVETIASHGFVVVSADHAGNTAIDALLGTQTDFETSARNRILDAKLLIDRVAEGELAAGLADVDRVAIMGHSFGGFTALGVAGGYADIPADERIDAVIPLAPASTRVSDEALASIEVPVLIITGSEDESTPVEDQSTRPLELVSGPAVLVLIDGGTHQVVTNICDILDAVSAPGVEVPDGTVETAQQLAGGTCDASAAVDVEDAFDITERYAVSFLLDHLAGDDRYAEVETPEGATVRA